MKRKLLMLLAAVCALVLAACTITEGSDDLIMKALILSSKDAGIGAVVKVSVGEVSRKALPSVQSAEEFESFSLTGTKKADGESSGRSGADIERTWTTDGEGNASSKMSAESIEVTAGAEYSFVLEAKKGGATYRGTAEKKMETGVNSLSFTLSLSGLSGEGKGSLSVTLSVPGAVKAVEAVLTAEDGSGTASPADAGIAFADGKATYTASEVASGNYVLTFILYADEAKTLKIGEWREYAGITDALTSSSSPAIKSAEELENIYSITLNTNGGTLIGTAPGSYTKYSSTITLPDESGISREEYKFLGWYDAETGGNKVESIAQGSTGEKVLYARWTAVEYTITYVLQEGITNPNPGSYTVETATITLQDVSREGYKFLGWYDAETGGNKVESIAQGSSGTKKLWAYWEILTFTVTISVNDQITETRTVEYGQTTAQPAAPAVADGYLFKCWVTDEGAFDFSTQIKKDMDIKARLLKKLELKSGTDIRSILLNSLSGGSAKKFAKSSEKKDSLYYLDNNQKIPVWYEQESETIWYYLEPDSIMTLAQDSSKMFANCRYIEAIETCDFDTSEVKYMNSMFSGCYNLTSLDVSNFDTSKVTNMKAMFYDCEILTSLDVSKFDTSEVTNMEYMFYGCFCLKELDLSKFDTSKVTNMNSMFVFCESLTSLDVSKFDTSKVTNMASMFEDCTNLTSLDVSKFDTSKVTNMASMFSDCHGLTNLKISNFNTSKFTDMRSMFRSCFNLTTIYAAAGTDWGSIENISSDNMFLNCNSLKGGNNTVYDESKTDKTYARIDGLDGKPGYFTIRPGEYAIIYILPEGVTNPNPKGYTVETATITLQDVSREGYKFLGWYDAETGGNKVESIAQGSSGTKKLWAHWEILTFTVTISVNDQITETRTVEYGQTTAQPAAPAVADGYLFKCWVTDEGAFDFSTQIKKDMDIKARLLKKLELKSGTDIRSILLNSLSGGSAKKFAKSSEKKDSQYYLDNNQKIPVWYEQESETIWYYLEPDSIMTLAQDSSEMFANCSYIEAIETCDFDTSKVTNMSYMFFSCCRLTSLDVSKFDTSKVKDMSYMFSDCTNLTSLDVSKFDTSEVTNMEAMFCNCFVLKELDVSKFDTSKVTNMGCMFSDCHGLTNLKISNFNTSKVTNMRYMFMSCFNLTTIYAAEGTDWGSIENISSDNMFLYCNSLKGGNNTVYDESKTDKTYARIDGLDGKPGYFTVKPAATE